MNVRMKIQARLDTLEAQLKAGEHLRSAEGMIAVLNTISSVSKFWRTMTDEERDFVNAARDVLEDELEWKALNQAARELLLAQSSDWAFIMRTGTMVPYAVRRTRSHLMRFNKLYEDINIGKIDSGWLEKVEYIDNIFPSINYRAYRTL